MPADGCADGRAPVGRAGVCSSGCVRPCSPFSAGDDNRARAADLRPEAEDTMSQTSMPTDAERAAARHYLLRFEVDTLRSRPLWIRLIIEFLGTFILVTVAAGAGVINHYAGGNPISRTAAVIAPGAVVMAM